MNNTVSTTIGRHDHPPPIELVEPRPIRRVGLLDRVALHLGVALIKWGRRPAVERDVLQALHLQRQLQQLEYRRALDGAHLMMARMR